VRFGGHGWPGRDDPAERDQLLKRRLLVQRGLGGLTGSGPDRLVGFVVGVVTAHTSNDA
jgi:hypothetical protein